MACPSVSHAVILTLSVSTVCWAVDPPGQAVPLSGVSLDESTLRVHFIDIGGGMAALIETPGGKHILLDGGKKGKFEYEQYVDHFVGDNPIDILIVTHADDDHFFNLIGFIEEYDVGEYWNTGYTSKKLRKLKRWPRFLDIIEDLEANGMENWTPLEDWVIACELETIDDRGTATTADDVAVQYLNVDKQPALVDPVSNRSFAESERRNNASLVFKLIYGKTSFLFTGDINGREKGDQDDEAIDSEERELLERHQQQEGCSLKATVLQVSHHGSDGSSSIPFLRAVDPTWAVIPVGNAHGHPDAPTLLRLDQVVAGNHILRTDDGPDGNDPTSDDNFVFVVNQNRISKIIRIKVE